MRGLLYERQSQVVLIIIIIINIDQANMQTKMHAHRMGGGLSSLFAGWFMDPTHTQLESRERGMLCLPFFSFASLPRREKNTHSLTPPSHWIQFHIQWGLIRVGRNEIKA